MENTELQKVKINCKKRNCETSSLLGQGPCLHSTAPLSPPRQTCSPVSISFPPFLPSSLTSLAPSVVLNLQEGIHNVGTSNRISRATMKSQSSMALQSWDTGLWQALGFFVLFSFSLCQKYWNSRLETQGITCKHSLPLFLCSSLTRRETYSYIWDRFLL